MTKATTLLALTVILMSGCAAEVPASPTPPAIATVTQTSAATPTPSPSPSYWTNEEAGQKYLQMVKPVNAAIADMGATFEVSEGTWRRLKSQCAALVKANDAFMRSLSAGKWDPSVRPAVDAVIKSSSASHSWWVKCAAAKDLEALDALGSVTQEDPGAPQRLRVALGLPSVAG